MQRKTQWRSRFLIPINQNFASTLLILLILVILLIQGCGSTSGGKSDNQSRTPGPANAAAGQKDELDQAMSLDQALITFLDDNRPQVLEQMGPPDIFKITFQDLNGTRIRQEEWSYLDDQIRFDFINGALAWTINLNATPDGSVNASLYDPMSFTDGMTVDEVQALLKDQQLSQVDLTDYGTPASLVLAGNQILFGFDAGNLVYVRTFELVPGMAQ